MHVTRWIAAAALIALAGCGPKPPPAAPVAENLPEDTTGSEAAQPEGAPRLATPPFTAEQIRDATKVGRTYRFVMHQGEQDLNVTVRFSAVTPEGATIERNVVDASGNTLDQGTEETTWEQLMDHAAFPADATEIAETTVEVPAGKFDVLLYTIKTEQEGKAVVSRMYFARSLPGAPIKAEVTIGDQPMFSMELVEHVPGQ
jgi:predicted small lipoprotein YifL